MLDLGLPAIDGIEVIQNLRTWTPVPIIVLSGRIDSHDKVNALDSGADDYLTKPFSLDELLARVRAVARRRIDPEPSPTVTLGQFTVDLHNHVVHASVNPEETVHLTRTEWQLYVDVRANDDRAIPGEAEVLGGVGGDMRGGDK